MSDSRWWGGGVQVRYVRRNESSTRRRLRQLEQRPVTAASEPPWAATERPQAQRKRDVSVRPGRPAVGPEVEVEVEGLMTSPVPRHGVGAGGATTSCCGDGLVSPNTTKGAARSDVFNGGRALEPPCSRWPPWRSRLPAHTPSTATGPRSWRWELHRRLEVQEGLADYGATLITTPAGRASAGGRSRRRGPTPGRPPTTAGRACAGSTPWWRRLPPPHCTEDLPAPSGPVVFRGVIRCTGEEPPREHDWDCLDEVP